MLTKAGVPVLSTHTKRNIIPEQHNTSRRWANAAVAIRQGSKFSAVRPDKKTAAKGEQRWLCARSVRAHLHAPYTTSTVCLTYRLITHLLALFSEYNFSQTGRANTHENGGLRKTSSRSMCPNNPGYRRGGHLWGETLAVAPGHSLAPVTPRSL